MPFAISMVLLRDEVSPSIDAIQEDFRTRWPEAPPPTDAKGDGTTLSFRSGSVDIMIGMIAVPMPWSDLEGPCETSVLWPHAAEDIKDHRAHFIVSVAADVGAIELTALLTKATASVMSVCDASLGVYWGNATMLVPKELFIEMAQQFLPHDSPVPLWVDFRVGGHENGGSAGFTYGLAALGCMEFEAPESPEPPLALRERLMDFAAYLIEKGPVIKDGDTVGTSATERIRVTYAASQFGLEGQVMRLGYDAAPAKPWWKIF